ncbi:aldo/keto reductase [candidate division KSB1 bacterium]|nr:aldo/keto reductase [candidate division KSB1 bacterium]
METRQLGKSDLYLTPIGLGTWAMGGGDWAFGWGPQDDEVSIYTIHKAIDLGINWIDTAPVYGLGHSEEVVGRALKGLSAKPYIATKCSRVWDSDGKIGSNLSKKNILKEADDSLRRLGVDVIDLYQIHWPNPKDQIEEGWDAVARLIQAGKVRYGGVSNFSVQQIERIQPIHPITSLQPPYSMLKCWIEDSLPFCKENQIGVIPYSPMQKGLLTGKITKERIESLSADDHRKNDPMFQEPELSINLEFVDRLHPIAEKYGTTLSQLAVAWTLFRPEITGAIVGGRCPDQIEEVVGAAGFHLYKDDYDEIEQLLDERKKRLQTI